MDELAGFFLLGLGNAGVVVTTRPLMMLVTPREFMGRMQAFSESFSTASTLLGATLASTLWPCSTSCTPLCWEWPSTPMIPFSRA